jgi:flagellar protein FliJ
MKSMANLIRVHKWKLDEQRRVVSDLDEVLATFVAKLEALEQEFIKEQEVAGQNTESGFGFAQYAEATSFRRQNLQATISDFGDRLEQARDEMAEMFQELKKYEISEETRLRLLKEQQDKRQQDEVDDFSIEMFRRKAGK